MEIRLLIRGDRACFRRPEFAEDLITYDVMTPRAARDVCDEIYTIPGLRWHIDEIAVLAPIRSTWMALAEVEHRGSTTAIIAGQRDGRMAHVLCDVRYIVTVHAEQMPGGSVPAEHIVRERARSERLVRQPCLGHRAFPAEVVPLLGDDPLPANAWAGSGAVDLGWMLYDCERDDESPRFIRATMIDGVIDLRRRESLILAG